MAATVEAELYGALQGLVGGRCFPLEAPARAERPYVVYAEFFDRSYVTAEGDTGLRRAVYQLTVVAETFDGARALKRQAQDVVNGYRAGCVNRMAVSGGHVQRDVDTGLVMQVLDVEIYYVDEV